MAYILGVDGGNTKTDYLLYDTDGNHIGHLHAGTCSHEQLGMDGARREMASRIGTLLSAHGLSPADIAASAFGLAGIDQREQQATLTEIIRGMGFVHNIAANDSFLGLKAGSESGMGICSINGTGSAAGGIDMDGRSMQVGGYGALCTGDEAGGSYIAVRTIRAVYDERYRFGPQTALTPALMALFGCMDDPEDFHTAISVGYLYGTDVTALDIIQALFAQSHAGDAVARGIVLDVADALARSAAGCALRLRFGGIIPVVLIGSVWTKGRHQPMIDHFQAQFERHTQKESALHILQAPPVAGSILWALELATGQVPTGSLRAKILTQAERL